MRWGSDSLDLSRERAARRDGGLYRRQTERGLLASCSVPDFRDLERVGLRRIRRDHLAEAAQHRVGAAQQDGGEGVTLSWSHCDLSDQSLP